MSCAWRIEEQRIAERLNYLFQTVFPRGEGPQSNERVSLAVGVSVEEIVRLRSGEPLPVPTPAELFRARLTHLLTTRLAPRTMTDAAEACGKSRRWLYNLCDPEKSPSGPSLDSTVAFAQFFGVDTTFFTDAPLEALSRHFGVESSGAEFFTAADNDPAVTNVKEQIEVALALRSASRADGRIPAVLGRILGTFPTTRGQPDSTTDVG
ncbi:helix-turn-helix domain-containing protein [Streptomyces sp. NPDC059003]|uniref:helix-turn-helix domain-containing protein n=1 Tax=Streptomyces sp. NPDC059003 TaxID=3346691 RepID=UPI0036813C24